MGFNSVFKGLRFIANNFETFANSAATNAVRPVHNTALDRTLHPAIILDNLLLFPSIHPSRWRYSPGLALASSTICLQASRFLALSLHSFIPIFLRSMDTSSSHLILGLPLRLVACSFPVLFSAQDIYGFRTQYKRYCFSVHY